MNNLKNPKLQDSKLLMSELNFHKLLVRPALAERPHMPHDGINVRLPPGAGAGLVSAKAATMSAGSPAWERVSHALAIRMDAARLGASPKADEKMWRPALGNLDFEQSW